MKGPATQDGDATADLDHRVQHGADAAITVSAQHTTISQMYLLLRHVPGCTSPDQDVVAPGRMRRKIHNPRVLLLDCPLEYKKGENQTNVELTKEEDWCAPDLPLPHVCA